MTIHLDRPVKRFQACVTEVCLLVDTESIKVENCSSRNVRAFDSGSLPIVMMVIIRAVLFDMFNASTATRLHDDDFRHGRFRSGAGGGGGRR